MCAICGCGQSGHKAPLVHHHDHGHHHDHDHQHDAERMVRIEQDILGKNDFFARQNRGYFEQHHILAINLVSSPGAGKTTLLVETINSLKDRIPIAVIEGDQQTEHDAERIRAAGVPALQINTGKACHLDAHGIGHALTEMPLRDYSILAIENVGNLVCPAAFDLGESYKVAVLSVTEGDDKPIKYPDMFRAAQLMIINKIDLLPYVDFDVKRCIDYARKVNPTIEVIQLSATKAAGFSLWTGWLEKRFSETSQITHN
jgi:hydrogenase nickel incorporation protein HypB